LPEWFYFSYYFTIIYSPPTTTTTSTKIAEPTDTGETLPNISISTKHATDGDGPPESTITLEVSSGQSIIPSIATGVISVSSVGTGSVATAASETGAAHYTSTSQVLLAMALVLVFISSIAVESILAGNKCLILCETFKTSRLSSKGV
jgi:hypothetical protein